MAVDRVNWQIYQCRRKAKTIVPFTVIARSKAIILGRQPLYTVPAPSTAQADEMVLPTWINIYLQWVFNAVYPGKLLHKWRPGSSGAFSQRASTFISPLDWFSWKWVKWFLKGYKIKMKNNVTGNKESLAKKLFSTASCFMLCDLQ